MRLMDKEILQGLIEKGGLYFIKTTFGNIYTRCRLKEVTDRNLSFIDRYQEVVYLDISYICEIRPDREGGGRE